MKKTLFYIWHTSCSLFFIDWALLLSSFTCKKLRFTAIIIVAKIFNMIFGAPQNSGPWASALLAIWLIRPWPYAQTAIKQHRAFSVVVPSAWNSLPSELRSFPRDLSSSLYKLLNIILTRAWTRSTSE